MDTALVTNYEKAQIGFNRNGSPSIHNLLDTIAQIIATEYVQKARENPTAFKGIASPLRGPQ